MQRLFFAISFLALTAAVLRAAPPPPIHVEGRHLVDDKGHTVRLAGAMHPFHPYFCGNRWGWGTDDAAIGRCLDYFDKLCAALTERKQGMYANMIRVTDDGYFVSDDRKKPSKDAPYFYGFDKEKFRRYLDKLLVPMVENAVRRGLYVVIRPSYCSPGTVPVGGDYHRHIIEEWAGIAAHPRLQALSGQVILELQNEPTTVLSKEGYKSEAALPDYCQEMLDMVRRKGFRGVVLVPGAGYQSYFRDFLAYPIRDPLKNYGYAVHVYPGWYAQNDETADPERMFAHFIRSVPVALDYPCVVTEVDWSPEKEGTGKLNEFGKPVKANHGTWGTASTSKWGNAYLETLERLGNVSTICGDVNTLFGIDAWLKEGKIKVAFEGNPECSGKALFDLYARWAKAKPAKPAARNGGLPHRLEGDEIVLKKTRHLTTRLFRLATGRDELHIRAEGNGWDFSYGDKWAVGRSGENAALFKAVPHEVEGKTYYQIRCYRENGVLRLSGLDGGNGDSLFVGKDGRGLYEGTCRANGKVRFGQDVDFDALWEIAEVDGGFTFRNKANGRYLGDRDNRQSETPVVWECATRAVRPSHHRVMASGS